MTSLLRYLMVLDADESGSGFDSVVTTISRKGLLVAGSLGVVVTLFYVTTHLLFLGFEPGWTYETGRGDVLVMWDKLALIAVSIVGVVASRTRLGAERGRMILGALIVAAAVAMLLDDLAGGHSAYSVGYLTVVMIVAVGTVPFKPIHILALCFLVLVMLVVGPIVAATIGWPDHDRSMREVIYWVVCTALFVGVAALIYRSRYEQFVAQKAIERADLEIRDQAEKLAELEQIKSRFFAAISHEFRTPITLILGPSVDALEKDESLSKETRKSLELIARSGRRLGELVEQLLDLSRLDEGRLPLNVAPYDLYALIRRSAIAFESLAESRQMELVIESELEDTTVYVDAEQMQKVIENLLSNAFKYTEDGGKIRISIYSGEEPGTLAIKIKDNGVGIPASNLKSVFDRFFQVSETSRKSAPGSGIGLALVKELVEMHGGSVMVESEEGFGTEFTVILRRGSEHFSPDDLLDQAENGLRSLPETGSMRAVEELVPSERAARLELESAEARSDRLPTVLLVDDHPDMLIYLSQILADGYNVMTAPNGREGLERAKASLPDLIITDVMMPEMDGYEMCSAVKADSATAHIPVIMVTAKATRESRLEGLIGGADDYILKPFDADELRVRVENLIEIRRALSRLAETDGFEVKPRDIEEMSADEKFMDRVTEIVEERMADTNFTVEWLAEEVGLGRRQLERRVKDITRLTPGGYIRMMRLKRAAQLIEARVGTISEIAYRVGFNDPNYFSRLFRQTFGVPPSEHEGLPSTV